MEDKEEIYNKVILPLTRQIYDLCKAHSIPYQMCFQVSDEALRGGYFLPETASARLHIVQDIIERGPSGFIASIIGGELSEPVVVTKVHD
jgi:phosphorylcholine metabolism protein LicD